MQVLEKKTKGFTLLELLVVIAILGILSATAYPNISSWIKERKVRQAAGKIKNLISGVNTQVQRGSYELVQVRFIEDGSITIFTSGMGMISLASKKKDDERYKNENTRCNIDNDYWDDLGSDGGSPGGVGQFISDDIVINFASDTAAVCFSKDGSYFKESGIKKTLNICLRTNTVFRCSVNSDGEPDMDLLLPCKNAKYIYRIRWSRFGSVNMDKWVAEYNDKPVPKCVMIYGGWVAR